MWKHQFETQDQDSRLDLLVPKIYSLAHPEAPITRSRFQTWVDEGHVMLNGKPAKSSERINAGDIVEIQVPEIKTLDLTPIPMKIDILYEDAHLAIINKPAGISVHPSDTDTAPTLVHGLLHHFGKLSEIGGVYRPGIIHRLDKFTSGSLVITKTDQAHQGLAEVFARHDIERVYWAICYSAPMQTDEIKIETELGRHPVDRKKMAVLESGGKHAITYAKLKARYGDPGKLPFGSWMECRLETGRTHQVRVHLTSIGLPLMGDPVYGKSKTVPNRILEKVKLLPGQALHARTIGFKHPVTKEFIRFDAPPPHAFQELLLELKRYETG